MSLKNGIFMIFFHKLKVLKLLNVQSFSFTWCTVLGAHLEKTFLVENEIWTTFSLNPEIHIKYSIYNIGLQTAIVAIFVIQQNVHELIQAVVQHKHKS